MASYGAGYGGSYGGTLDGFWVLWVGGVCMLEMRADVCELITVWCVMAGIGDAHRYSGV